MIYIYLKRNLTFLTFDLNDNFEKKNRINNLSSIYKLIDLYKNTQKNRRESQITEFIERNFSTKITEKLQKQKRKKKLFFPCSSFIILNLLKR